MHGYGIYEAFFMLGFKKEQYLVCWIFLLNNELKWWDRFPSQCLLKYNLNTNNKIWKYSSHTKLKCINLGNTAAFKIDA